MACWLHSSNIEIFIVSSFRKVKGLIYLPKYYINNYSKNNILCLKQCIASNDMQNVVR